MDRQLTRQEKATLFDVLEVAMRVLRDGKSSFEENSRFGKQIRRNNWYGSQTREDLVFKNDNIPRAEILVTTQDDPLDYTDDRNAVPIIPSEFEAHFASPVTGVSIDEIKNALNVEDFWADESGHKYVYPPGGLQISPRGTVFSYRYSAKQTSEMRFEVTASITYLAPDKTDASDGVRWLNNITLTRDYPYLTPEMRKQKREEATARGQAAYGQSKGTSQ
ncbi:hypothetical protein F3J17_21395 [Burkholderia sp. Ax-1719]|nr:hypothetical protein [Burkholderia sp. Ax-1719]